VKNLPISVYISVIPAKAGIQSFRDLMDSRLRGNDNKGAGNENLTLYGEIQMYTVGAIERVKR
jgi:hypothetical protein